MILSTWHRTWLSLDRLWDFNNFENNEKWKTMICFRVPSDLIVFGWQRGDFNSLSWKTLSLRQKSRWPSLSLRAIELDCLWIAKVADDYNGLHVSSDLIVFGWRRGDFNSLSRKTLSLQQRGADDHICLCVPSNMTVSGWRRGDFNSLDWKTLSLWQREQMTIFVSACHQTRLSLDSKGGRWP